MRNLLDQLDRRRPYRIFDRPIFILAAPRSGSSFLFELLSRFADVWHWHAELDAIWWEHFPYERLSSPSDYIGAEECTPELASRVRRDHYRYARWGRDERGERCRLRDKLGLRRVRLLDKTIANCFHLEVLERVFPDALYLFLVRDPRATISSMMEGWRKTDAFSKPQLQPWIDAAQSTVDYWSYPAPLGWQAMLSRPLEEICAWSWQQHVESVSSHLESISEGRKCTVRYEDLVQTPERVARYLERCCGLTWSEALERFLEERPLSRTTVSAPDSEKWQRLHGEVIERVLPAVGPTMTQLGY